MGIALALLGAAALGQPAQIVLMQSGAFVITQLTPERAAEGDMVPALRLGAAVLLDGLIIENSEASLGEVRK